MDIMKNKTLHVIVLCRETPPIRHLDYLFVYNQ